MAGEQVLAIEEEWLSGSSEEAGEGVAGQGWQIGSRSEGGGREGLSLNRRDPGAYPML